MALFVLILVALWILGVTYSYSMGGYIHVLLAVAVVIVVYHLFLNHRAGTISKE